MKDQHEDFTTRSNALQDVLVICFVEEACFGNWAIALGNHVDWWLLTVYHCQSQLEDSRMQVTSHLWQWSGSNALWFIWFLIMPSWEHRLQDALSLQCCHAWSTRPAQACLRHWCWQQEVFSNLGPVLRILKGWREACPCWVPTCWVFHHTVLGTFERTAGLAEKSAEEVRTSERSAV